MQYNDTTDSQFLRILKSFRWGKRKFEFNKQ